MRVTDRLFGLFGYVPASTHVPQREVDDLVRKLEHKSRNLQAEIHNRAMLEQHVAHMRDMERLRAAQDTGIQRAVQQLDSITAKLADMLAQPRDEWVEAYAGPAD